MTVIKTKDFILRPLRISDAESYFETMQDKETQANLMSYPKTLSESKKEIIDMLKEVRDKGCEYFSIQVKGKFAGNILLQHQYMDKNNDEGRVHLWIHPDFRGKGLATKALDEVVKYGLDKKFRRIYAQCKAMNKGVIKINEKLGFRKVRTYVTREGIKKILWVKEKPCNKCDFKSDLVIKEYLHWIAELSDSPTPIGWIYIILKERHIEYFDELTDTELSELKTAIKELKSMLIKAFSPDWFNVMQLGNGGRHIHFHLVPRYIRKIKFAGKTFSDPDYGRMLVDRYKPADKKFLIKLRDYLKKNLK